MAGFVEGYLEWFNRAIAEQWHGGDWWSACGVALLISAAVAAIGWMLSELLGSPELKAWAKKEVGEFLTTAVIVALLVLIIPTIFAISIALTGENPINSAKMFLTGNTGDIANPSMEEVKFDSTLYGQNLKVATGLSTQYGVYLFFMKTKFDFSKLIMSLMTGGASDAINVALPWIGKLDLVGMSILPFVTIGSILPFFGVLISLSLGAVFATVAQWTLLDFFERTAFMFLLPLGIVMRTFPLTRAMGSTLIAFAIVCFVVFPLTVNLSKVIFDGMGVIPELPKELSFESKSLIIPLPSPAKVNRADSVSWIITSEKEGIYRIWAGSDLSKCTGDCYTGELPPAVDATYTCWKSIFGPNNCMLLVTRSAFAPGATVTMKIGDVVKSERESNRIYSFIIDAYEGPIFLGFDEQRKVVGDPCKANWWTRVSCWLGITSRAETGVTRGQGAEAFFAGFADAFVQFGKDFGGAFTYKSGWAVMPPVLVAGMFLNITERLPSMLYPVALTIFMLVSTAMISLSSFRSISSLLGGETKLPRLLKVL